MGEDLLSLKWNNHKPAFFHLLRVLREKGCYTDVTLACGSKFFAVHRLVLMACSDFFSEVFDHTQCQKPVIVLKDIKSHELEALLDYMYLGEVDVQQADLPGLIKAAECLRIKGLAVPDEDPAQLARVEPPTGGERPAKRRRQERETRESDRGGTRSHSAQDRTPHGAPADDAAQYALHGPEVVQGDGEDEAGCGKCAVPQADDESPHPAVHEAVQRADGLHLQQETEPSGRLHEARLHHDPRTQQEARLQHEPQDQQVYTQTAPEIKTEHCEINEDIDNGGLKSEITEIRGDPMNEASAGGEFSHFLSVEENLAHHMFQQAHQAGPSGLHRAVGREGTTDMGGDDGNRGGGVGGSMYPTHLLGDVAPEGASTLANQSDPIPSLIHLVEGPAGDNQPIAYTGAPAVDLQYDGQRSQSSGERQYECMFCGRLFNHRGTLTRHVMIHTGEKPFLCQYCNFKTSRKSTLNYHMHSLHASLLK
ncbi:zinc finger and BTB domain-containing protein 17-like isoform X2 [Homarus americanus]|uniref:zinc finger and BTB domain-containing protein 17-like isoform X2 n=1 Tax=Homarus americanus TaxID=6706 RepID=UPI001C477719|nr:zinc finger and BTB domain-containing protein 17-like isoform X2 [Homarus americanus]